jgi:hypothetical protein
MYRLLSGAAGILLVVTPPFMVYSMTVPVPQYRTGTLADYHAFLVSCLTVYGGVVLGIAVRVWREPDRASTIHGRSIFRAGVTGGLVAVGVALALASLQSGAGNLWGLVVIFGAAFTAIVSAGAGLVWHAIRPGTTDSPSSPRWSLR